MEEEKVLRLLVCTERICDKYLLHEEQKGLINDQCVQKAFVISYFMHTKIVLHMSC